MPVKILHVYGSPSDSKYQDAGLVVFQKIYSFSDREFFNSEIDLFDVTLSADRVEEELAQLGHFFQPDITVAGAGLVNVLATACMKFSKLVIGVPLGDGGYQISSTASVLDKAPGCPLAVVPPNAAASAANLALLIANNDFRIYSDDIKGILKSYGITYGKLSDPNPSSPALVIFDYIDSYSLEEYEKSLPDDSIIIAYNSRKFDDYGWADWIKGMAGLSRTLFVGNGRVENAFHLAAQIKSIHNPSIYENIIADQKKAKIDKYGPEIERVKEFLGSRR